MRSSILVVEDEPSIADNILYALQTEGFDTRWCTTANEAVHLFSSGLYDLVILDIGLPDQNGFDLCKRLREGSSVPIIFVTARKDEIDRVVGLEIGGDDYIVKPFSPRELAARVRAVLRRVERAAPLPASDTAPPSPVFAIDDERLEILYHGVPLTLSRYEYRLLKALLERPGKVFTRDELMHRAWEEPGSALDRTVDAHIKTIRAKLQAIAPGSDPIKTHRGIGYALLP